MERQLLGAGSLVPALLTLLAAGGTATAEVLHLDPASSRVEISLDAGLHYVHGVFQLQEGSIVFDPASGEASGRVVVSAASGSTDNGKRDRKMHEKVLESVRFPDIVLVPHRLEGSYSPAGDSDVRLAGTLELHGEVHEVVIPARVHVEGDRVTGSAEITIPYVAWGLVDPSFLVFRVAKDVQVSLSLSGAIAAGR